MNNFATSFFPPSEKLANFSKKSVVLSYFLFLSSLYYLSPHPLNPKSSTGCSLLHSPYPQMSIFLVGQFLASWKGHLSIRRQISSQYWCDKCKPVQSSQGSVVNLLNSEPSLLLPLLLVFLFYFWWLSLCMKKGIHIISVTKSNMRWSDRKSLTLQVMVGSHASGL